jgi:TRAP-type C4-dicarboxylate transport system permease large subunit
VTNGILIFLMAFLFLFLGYLGVPVAFALIAGVLVVTAFTPVGLPSIMTQLFNGIDVEALLAVPFFLLVGIGLMIYSHFFGPIGVRRRRSSFGEVIDATKGAAVPLVIPVIIMGGILSGFFTPTEAGVVAVAYILFVAIPALNRGYLRRLPHDLAHTGLLYSIPLITIAAASAFGWMLAYLRGPAVVSGWITSAAGNDPFMVMLLLVALFIIVGDFIDAIPAIIIFMPIITDLTQTTSINPVHMGVVIIVTLAFGLITPPYGIALLMASKFIGVGFGRAMFASFPIYVVFLAAILFCIFFPEVVLWLPKHFLPESVGCFKNPSGAGYICP